MISHTRMTVRVPPVDALTKEIYSLYVANRVRERLEAYFSRNGVPMLSFGVEYAGRVAYVTCDKPNSALRILAGAFLDEENTTNRDDE